MACRRSSRPSSDKTLSAGISGCACSTAITRTGSSAATSGRSLTPTRRQSWSRSPMRQTGSRTIRPSCFNGSPATFSGMDTRATAPCCARRATLRSSPKSTGLGGMHLRAKFEKAVKANDACATVAFAYFKSIRRVEASCKDERLSPEERKARRDEDTRESARIGAPDPAVEVLGGAPLVGRLVPALQRTLPGSRDWTAPLPCGDGNKRRRARARSGSPPGYMGIVKEGRETT